MQLITPYSPPSFLRPVLIVSTVYTSATKETALVFVEALNNYHALSALGGDGWRTVEATLGRKLRSGFIPIRQHASREEAISYHLAVAKDFINGGSDAEWELGQESYHAMYERYCPTELRSAGALKREEAT